MWSEGLYKNENVIVTLGKNSVRRLADLKGKTIGTVLHYRYTDLDAAFEKYSLMREDGPDIVSNIQKLLHARLSYIVMARQQYDYYKKSVPALETTNIAMTPAMVLCVLSAKSKIRIQDLNRAIMTIKKNGTLKAILKSYTENI